MIDCTERAEITPENWQQLILDAIKELPHVIGHEVPDPNSLNVRLWGKQREIRFVWWNTYGEELTDQIKRYPGIGIEARLELAKAEGKIDWPIISYQFSGSGSVVGLTVGHGIFPRRVSIDLFKEMIREAVGEAINR
jgi:hypothetical protein